jgi:putative endonuclease
VLIDTTKAVILSGGAKRRSRRIYVFRGIACAKSTGITSTSWPTAPAPCTSALQAIGITSKMMIRTIQHKEGRYGGFTSKYKVDRLVYYEVFTHVQNAIAREKQLKGWSRIKKIGLIVSTNPTWKDLSEEWGKSFLPLIRKENA